MEFDSRTETFDSILNGAVWLVQPRAGYRFSLDAILLASFAHPRQRDRLLDLGAGCGVIATIVAITRRPREVVAIEIQTDLAELARRNFAFNQLAHATAIAADLRARKIAGAAPGSFDYVVANPPYHALRRGRESPNASRHVARGAGGASIRDFIAAASRYATGNGRVAMIFPASRCADLLVELRAKSLEPKRLRFVQPYAESPATLIMVEARKGAGVEGKVAPPLIVWQKPGVYTDEARGILDDAGANPFAKVWGRV
ncbi:MAG TPA: methyltransferase [Candidatus Binataceae bacterium]|nr:methyltransferase [Candidatus Binataceae bacterium]